MLSHFTIKAPKKQTTKFSSARFKENKNNNSIMLLHTEESKKMANSIDPVEVAHYEPSHLDLPCLSFNYLFL